MEGVLADQAASEEVEVLAQAVEMEDLEEAGEEVFRSMAGLEDLAVAEEEAVMPTLLEGKEDLAEEEPARLLRQFHQAVWALVLAPHWEAVEGELAWVVPFL